jgi:hypothetical protein
MTESRVLTISAPKSDDSFTIDWDLRFTAGKDGAVLDRTPMPGEPNGAVNGGYAGLSVRLAPLTMTVVSTEGPITDFPGSRARPNAAAVAGNFTDGEKQIGGIAILSDPANMGAKAPWYIINQERDKFRFICAACVGAGDSHARCGRGVEPAVSRRGEADAVDAGWTRGGSGSLALILGVSSCESLRPSEPSQHS